MKDALGVALSFAIGLVACGMVAQAAEASSTSKTVYSNKNWDVRAVKWSDGTSACVAEVNNPQETFSVWEERKHPIRLQFFSKGWHFGDSAANLHVRVDGRPSWNLNNANLYKNSVLFDLPNNGLGRKFLAEVSAGSTLYLSDNRGRSMRQYNLSGSGASMGALRKCFSALR